MSPGAPGDDHDGESQASQRQPEAKPFEHARTIFFALTGVAFVATLWVAQGVLLPFLLAILVAFVLLPAVRWFERIMPRWAAILAVYLVMIGSMVGFSVLVVPRLFEETKQLSAELPKLTQRISEDWLPRLDARLQQLAGGPPAQEPLSDDDEDGRAPIVIHERDDGSFEVQLDRQVEIRKKGEDAWIIGPRQRDQRPISSERMLRDGFDRAVLFVQKNSLEVLKIGRAIVAGVSRGIFYFFITLMLAGYMMFTHERIHAFVRETWPVARRRALDRFLDRLDRSLSGVVRGQLIICLVNGALSAVGFWMFDLKYWPILSIIAGVMSIIPIFGSILSSVPVVAIALTQSFGTAIGALLWIVGIHQLEANFLNPKIIGDQAKIHPVLVVFALLLGEHLFQIPGALLAVPTLALAQSIFMHFRESVLGLPAGGISRTSLLPASLAPTEVHVSSSVETQLVTTKRSSVGTAVETIDVTLSATPATAVSPAPVADEKRAVSTTLRSDLE